MLHFSPVRALLLLLFSGFALAAEPIPSEAPSTLPDSDDAAYPAIERYVKVLEQVRKLHPDASKAGYDRLVNHSLEGMLSSLDPFSSFIHPEMARAMEANPKLDPYIPSLGITLGLREDGVYLANAFPSFPAAQAGLLPGSAILAVDGNPPPELADLIQMLQKAPGETTTLKVKSETAPKPIEVKLVHIVVEDRAITASRLLADGTTGYIRLASFTATCHREMEAALDELEDKGMKSLIFDLRGNGGGDVNAAVQLTGLFLPPSTAVVSTRGRGGEQLGPPLKTPDRQRRKREYPLAVLLDHMSASASELTAGALQDLKRATIVGEVSYGKGSVQRIIPMGGGTALRLTFATYHTPSGRSPHGVGIIPDVAVTFTPADREKQAMFFRESSLSAAQAKELESWHDPAMEAALKSLH